jgi:hypothetical protein
LWVWAESLSLLFSFKAESPWAARSALSSSSTALAQSERASYPEAPLAVFGDGAVFDSADLAAGDGFLLGLGLA